MSQGQGDDPPFVLFIDVEKAFDKMLLEHQRRSLLQADLAPARVAAYLSEQLHSKVWARLGDVQSGPLAHSRGKQGGCGTPFSFNAMMTAALSKSFASWERRGFGIPLPASPARPASRFVAGVFADNLVLAGTYSQVVAMYLEATSAIAAMSLCWKPTSYCALGPSGARVVLPAAPGHAARTVACLQEVPWLGFHLAYACDWHQATAKAFEAANHAWHANRKVLYSRRLSLRCRLQVFSQTVVSVLLSRLVLLPLTARIVQRVRRFESRFLRALTGWQRASYSVPQYAEYTRKARKVAASCGHVDVTTAFLTRVFDTAGRWARIPCDVPDLALRSFAHAWDTALCGTWSFLRGHGVVRARLGRPLSGWDRLLDSWSGQRWRTWAQHYASWSDFRNHWLTWAARHCGFE